VHLHGVGGIKITWLRCISEDSHHTVLQSLPVNQTIGFRVFIMRFLELRGKSLIAVILLTSGLDFLLFGCKLEIIHCTYTIVLMSNAT
jgi:hypothetical protein